LEGDFEKSILRLNREFSLQESQPVDYEFVELSQPRFRKIFFNFFSSKTCLPPKWEYILECSKYDAGAEKRHAVGNDAKAERRL
jgi:hypothetical protein